MSQQVYQRTEDFQHAIQRLVRVKEAAAMAYQKKQEGATTKAIAEAVEAAESALKQAAAMEAANRSAAAQAQLDAVVTSVRGGLTSAHRKEISALRAQIDTLRCGVCGWMCECVSRSLNV